MINPILLDRITRIRTKGFLTNDKIQIATKHLIPSVCEELGLSPDTFVIGEKMICHLIENMTFEGGVRSLRKLLVEILNNVNLMGLYQSGKKQCLENNSKKVKVLDPVEITLSNLDKFLMDKHSMTPEKIHDKPTIGKINGLYATSADIGGIIPIESSFTPGYGAMQLAITGNLGKVMLESTQVAKTLAWNHTPHNRQQSLRKRWKTISEGIHIHCSDAAVQKEGPSAGTALTVTLYSLFNNIEIPNDIGVTGEINLSGEVSKIGGLRDKLYGAKRAGVKLCLFPIDNQHDFDQITTNYPDLIQPGKFEARAVSTLKETFDIIFADSRKTMSESGKSGRNRNRNRNRKRKRKRNLNRKC